MQYFFFVNYNSVVTEVHPLNWNECSLVDELEQDQIFYRRKFNGTLTFGGKKLCADFTLLHDIEAVNPYGRVDFLILKDLDVYWEGYFSTANGEWNLASKTFTVTPLVADDYEDWDHEGDLELNILDVTPTVTVECNGWSYTRNRWLLDVIEFLADGIFPGCTVESGLFTHTTDPVTYQPSRLQYLTIAAKSDIKRPTSSDPATVAKLSFNELMQILKMFNAYWKYDLATNVLTVEHLSYFTGESGLDLRTQEISKSMLTYHRDTPEMPKYEYFDFMEAKSADFKGIIWYDSPVVDPAKTVKYSNRVTTEIEYIQDTVLDGDTPVSDDGFVMLANFLSGGNYYTYAGPGIIDSVSRFNIPLSWSYLLLSYHRHGRILLSGYFNVTPTTFVSAKKTILHDINAIVCAELDSSDYITTELGETYFGGLKGYVKRANLRPYCEVNFTLKYGPEDNPNEGAPTYEKMLTVTRDDLDVYSQLSEPNVYDTYYSIWTNDDCCDVVMIPAGTTYQHDILTQINPIVSAKYNFTDDSLIGWSEVVDGSTTFDTCSDAECSTGSPAPPAIPGVPTILGHNQATTCGPVRISWAAEAGATYYILQRNPDLGGNPVWQTQYSGVALYYDDFDAGLHDGATYLYRLAACNISGCSAYCADYTVDDIMC